MAIDETSLSEILKITNDFWSQKVQTTEFSQLIAGKEPGHRMADYVDDQTTSLLKVSALTTRYEAKKGKIKKRSMGDVWVESSGIFNPVNVKSGLLGMNGQPNVVAMQKLLKYLCNKQIDSYYLLIVKFNQGKSITHKACLVDLLDWVDFITYDAGPGQIMLREQDFYQTFDSENSPPSRTIFEKVECLFQLYEQQLMALFKNREKSLKRQRSSFNNFRKSDFVVDQSGMEFLP